MTGGIICLASKTATARKNASLHPTLEAYDEYNCLIRLVLPSSGSWH